MFSKNIFPKFKVSLNSTDFSSDSNNKRKSPSFIKGLFFAPSVVASSVKTAVFASRILEKLGYNVNMSLLINQFLIDLNGGI